MMNFMFKNAIKVGLKPKSPSFLQISWRRHSGVSSDSNVINSNENNPLPHDNDSYFGFERVSSEEKLKKGLQQINFYLQQKQKFGDFLKYCFLNNSESSFQSRCGKI